MRIGIIGAGLLGTSLGLALKEHDLWIHDVDHRRQKLAADLTGAATGKATAEILIVATPVSAISEVVIDSIENNVAPTVTDLGSVKTKPVIEVYEKLSASDFQRYVPGHPIAGREVSGPEGARGDLFKGRPWVLTPGENSDSSALGVLEDLIRGVGSTPVRMSVQEHDLLVARISHLPQILASAAATIAGQGAHLELAGQGLKDLTRIAGSDPLMWSQILPANAPALSPLIRGLITRLQQIDEQICSNDEKSIYHFIDQGRSARALMPGKHGGKSTKYSVIPVVVEDRPGQLAALFHAAGEHQVNIEDVSMEHSPGQPSGLVELSVDPEVAHGFVDFLRQQGWRVHSAEG